jgi:protein arginine kinase activator
MKHVQCQRCSRQATIHLTNVQAGGVREEVHLCEPCAEKAKILVKTELNLSSILQNLLGSHVSTAAGERAAVTCPTCGIKYGEFRAEGRLGCPHDYEVFRAELQPLLQRIHHSGQHVGKCPRHAGARGRSHKELLELRRQLREAVDGERYEQAAQIRDLIRAKEQG